MSFVSPTAAWLLASPASRSSRFVCRCRRAWAGRGCCRSVVNTATQRPHLEWLVFWPMLVLLPAAVTTPKQTQKSSAREKSPVTNLHHHTIMTVPSLECTTLFLPFFTLCFTGCPFTQCKPFSVLNSGEYPAQSSSDPRNQQKLCHCLCHS